MYNLCLDCFSVCSYESQESLIGSYNGSEAESSVHKSTLSDRITAQHSIIEENSEVPDWLLDVSF